MVITVLVLTTTLSKYKDNNENSTTPLDDLAINFGEKNTSTILTAKINSGDEKEVLKENDYSIQSINPPILLRGRSFTSTGRLVDNSTGLGIPGMEIYVYWQYFSWAAYDADPNGLYTTYGLAHSTTNADGYFTITCMLNVLSPLNIGPVNVYTVFHGDAMLGPPQQNRQYTSEPVVCYATTMFVTDPISTNFHLRENESQIINCTLIYDNGSLVLDSEGENLTFKWLGTEYLETISSYYASFNCTIPKDTVIGQYLLKISFNISSLNLPYIVGSINNHALIGTTAADWINLTKTIYVESGAGISFSLVDPISPGPGEFPKVLRGQTQLNITGVLTDSIGDPFGYDVDLEIYVFTTNDTNPNYLESTAVANSLGEFSALFTLAGSYLTVGDNIIWLAVASGQGITAFSDFESITIVGNSSIVSTSANQTFTSSINYKVMPGEILHITGTARDLYDTSPISDMTITCQWEDFITIYSTNTSATGAFTFDLLVPSTLASSVTNGTIFLESVATPLYTAYSYNFTVDVFSEVNFAVSLNSTSITEDSTVTTVGGNPIYNNSTFTLYCNFTDQFDRSINRPTNNDDVTITVPVVGVITEQISNGRISYDFEGSVLIPTGTPITVTITFKEGIDFSFRITFQAYPTPTPTPSNSTPPGGINMGYVLIGILVALTAGIIIISVVYAFGRFRRTKKRPLMGFDVDSPDLRTILNQIDESERAKDFKRGTVLCYKAFESLCQSEFGLSDTSGQSPRELARIVAQTNRVPVRDVTMLVMRFEEARFSDHPISQESFTQARQALHNIQLSIEKGP
ncbi:MAG: DUF4129 domain-containing protein [Candidatus Thorarchaeota archaeon]